MASVFFSYSHHDARMRENLEIHLAQLKRQGIVQTWHDGQIRAGNELDQAISQELEQADIVLLLVSPHFLASRYCYDVEMKRALQRHNDRAAQVIPVILQPCDWKHPPLSTLLAVPRDGRPVSEFPNRNSAFLEIALAVRQAAESVVSRQSHTEPTIAYLRKRVTDGSLARRRREDLKLTQTEVARLAGITVSQVSAVETGRGATERVLRRLADVLKLADWSELVAESERDQTSPSQPWLIHEAVAASFPELQYDSLFKVRSYYVPYVKLHGSRAPGSQEYPEEHVRFKFDNAHYEIPEIIRRFECPRLDHDSDKVRLARYQVGQIADSGSTLLQAWFSPSPVKYSDFCRAAKNPDKPLPDDSSTTLRGRYAPRSSVNKTSLPAKLPNVGGVGVFVLARSRVSGLQRIIITHQAPSQTFSAGVWSYSASGTMDWPLTGAPNPFLDGERETLQEIDHAVDRAKLRLIGLGLDSKELYVQFSFVDETDRFAEDILDNADDAEHEFEWDEIMSVAFTPEAVIEALLMDDWEPAAAAALVTLASKHFGKDRIADLLIDRFRPDEA
jgi:transcriptional regulator with XRE-family HTH domain